MGCSPWGRYESDTAAAAERTCVCWVKVITRISQRRQWHPTPILLPGKSHGRRSLVGCSPWGRYKSDTTERLHFHFSLSCIGEGNGNPRQYSCLENPRDGGAWWAAIYGVAQSRPQLKRLSSILMLKATKLVEVGLNSVLSDSQAFPYHIQTSLSGRKGLSSWC